MTLHQPSTLQLGPRVKHSREMFKTINGIALGLCNGM